jgi:MFS family permease
MLKELNAWVKLGHIILPVIVFTIFISCYDAVFWTLGPLISEELTSIRPFGGLFLAMYFLPSMFMGFFVGNITKKYGKKRSAFVAMLLGSGILILIGFISNAILLLLIVFVSSILSAVAWPAIRAAFADYISESPNIEAELDGMGDLAGNVGYVIGPAAAGFLADRIGNIDVFSILGIVGVVLSLILLKFTPKHIHVSNKGFQ